MSCFVVGSSSLIAIDDRLDKFGESDVGRGNRSFISISINFNGGGILILLMLLLIVLLIVELLQLFGLQSCSDDAPTL